MGDVDLSSGFNLDSELRSLGGLSVLNDTAVSSSGIEDELDMDHAPSEFTEPEDDVEQNIPKERDEVDEGLGATEDDEKEGDPEMVHDGTSSFCLPF